MDHFNLTVLNWIRIERLYVLLQASPHTILPSACPKYDLHLHQGTGFYVDC